MDYSNMDFVKREDQYAIEDENFKAFKYPEMHQKHLIDIPDPQHTAISMEQLHQAMQSTMNSSIVHNLQLPLSPRQISTLMLKSNQIGRNLNFNDLPYLQKSELDILHMNEMHTLRPDMDLTLTRNLVNELEIQNGLNQSLVPNIEQDLRLELPQNLRDMSDIGQEIDLSHHLNRHSIEQEILAQDRRIMMQDSHGLEQNFAQTLEQSLAQRLDQVLAQRMGQRISMPVPDGQRVDEHLLQMPFQIKSEQEDDGYFYDNISQLPNVNGLNGHVQEHTPAQPIHQDSQLYSIYNNQIQNVPALNPLDIYARQQTYQNYVTRDNPQNLVVHRQFENNSPYEELKKREEENENSKIEQPKENMKPTDQNKIYYPEYNAAQYTDDNKKNENDSSVTNKMYTEDMALDIKGEYTCYKCQAIFPSKRALKQHSKSCLDHNTELEKLGKFSCSQCSYRCQSPAILKIHERTHTGEKPFSCTFCDYKSGQKNNVAKHILVHMKEKPFRCQYCNYRCAQKNNLVVHERTHTGYKPFACPYCDYRTVQKPNLVKHMYLHTDQKPFSCDMCSYRCVQKTNLTKHKQRHLNEKDGEKVDPKSETKPYRPRQKSVKCPHCTYRCVQKASLEKHMMFKHCDQAEGLNLKCGAIDGQNSVSEVSSASEVQSSEGEIINSDAVQNLSVRKDGDCQTLSHSVKV